MRQLLSAVAIMALLMAGLTAMTSPAAADSGKTAHAFSFRAADGGEINMSEFAGKAVLVVNTASQCNFVKQYGPLQALYEKYRDRGLVIVGVPSNDFGSQEPGSDAEIVQFASQEFRVDFPLASKTTVKGANATPFYRWAGDQVGIMGKPRWNFHKYLIGPDGKMVTWFSTMTEPGSKRLQAAIEKALPAAQSAAQN